MTSKTFPPPPHHLLLLQRNIFILHTHISWKREENGKKLFRAARRIHLSTQKTAGPFFSLSPPPALLTYYYSLIPPSPSPQLIQSHSTCNIISLVRT
jgi:hypothetical protein